MTDGRGFMQHTGGINPVARVTYFTSGQLPGRLRGRAKITSHFPAGSFDRGLRCSLLTDPRVGYARRSRLAGGQNSRAVKYEFIFVQPLII